MIKKEYQKPTMDVAQLKTKTYLVLVSQATTHGLGGNDSDKLKYKGEEADMEEFAW